MKKSLMLSLVFFAAAFLPCTGTAATWDILYSFNATGEGGQAGIETNGTHIYTAEWRANVSPAFYEYNMDGTFDHSFDIAGVSQLRDMAYDGTYFYGSPANLTIYIMDLENESLAGTITVNCTGITGVRHIAYDPELDGGSGGFWIGNWNELGAIDMNGNQIYANISPTVSSIYGSAYDDSTPGGPYLWLFSQSVNAVFHQFDIATRTFTGTTHDCSAVPGFNNGLAGGAATYISGGNLILLADIQQAPNLIVAYELAPEQGNSTWTVTYDGNGALAGTVPVDASSPYLAGATVTVLGNTGNLTRTGYVFGGWNTASDGNGTDYAADDTFVMPAQDIVLYAQWDQTWTVTYDGNGALAGTVPVDASSPYLAGATVTVLGNTGNLTRTGYVFGGWNTASDGNGTDYAADDTFVMPAQDIVLYAQWDQTWTVTYDGNGALAGTVPVDASSPYLAGATVTVLGNTGNLTRTGYVFGGWNTASDGNGTDYAADDTFVMPAQDIVLYAQWEEEQEIPTVSQWGMMILSLILAGITLGQILRQRN